MCALKYAHQVVHTKSFLLNDIHLNVHTNLSTLNCTLYIVHNKSLTLNCAKSIMHTKFANKITTTTIITNTTTTTTRAHTFSAGSSSGHTSSEYTVQCTLYSNPPDTKYMPSSVSCCMLCVLFVY